MVFVTGVPPLGFGDASPAVLFSDSGVLPTVSTCCLTLTFPRSFPAAIQRFKEKIDLSYMDSGGNHLSFYNHSEFRYNFADNVNHKKQTQRSIMDQGL